MASQKIIWSLGYYMLNGKDQARFLNIGLGWDGVNLLHCISYGDMLWICDQNSAGNSNVLATGGQCLPRVKDCFSIPTQQAGSGQGARRGESGTSDPH